MNISDDTAAVREANLSFYRAFESLDRATMEDVWSRDMPVMCVHPGWPKLMGWDVVMGSWERIFDNTSMMQFTITEDEIAVDGNLAFVVCTENITSVADGRVSEVKVQATNIYQRGGGRWLMVHHHGSPVL